MMGWALLRLFGFLVMAAVGLGGVAYIDFNTVRKEAVDNGDPVPGLADYISGVPERFTHATGSAGGGNLPSDLTEMLPGAPEGWTVRPVDLSDGGPFLPKSGERASDDQKAVIESVLRTSAPAADEVVVQTYEKGERRVVIKAILYPDEIFEGESSQQRFDLQMATARMQGRPFMTLRGLDISEVYLGDGMRGRLFVADVGGQIHLRILATKRMKDSELMPFFETLHVKAMNYAVVDRMDGLGEVPVIALASAMPEADRAAYETERLALREAAARQAQESLDLALTKARAAEAEIVVAADQSEEVPAENAALPQKGLASDCEKGSGGIKRCSVGSGD
jgi:hypothetical protein